MKQLTIDNGELDLLIEAMTMLFGELCEYSRHDVDFAKAILDKLEALED